MFSTYDITYFYASRLPDEPAGGVDDFHLTPGRWQLRATVRVTLRTGRTHDIAAGRAGISAINPVSVACFDGPAFKGAAAPAGFSFLS
jgi:hypothetical protein